MSTPASSSATLLSTRALVRLRAPLAMALCAVGALAATDARAQEPSLTISFEDPDTATPGVLEDQPINASFKVKLGYSLPQGFYQDLVITFPLPDRDAFPVTRYITETSNSSFTHGSTTNGVLEVHQWTASSSGAGMGSDIEVTLRFEAETQYDVNSVPRTFRTITGTAFPFTATISGRRATTEAGPYTDFSSTVSAERVATGTPIPKWDYTGAVFFGSYAATIGGQPGVVQRYVYRVTVEGNAGIRGYDWGTGAGGMPLTLQFGSAMHFLRAWVGPDWGNYPGDAYPPSSAADPTISVLSTPVPFGEVGHAAGGTLVVRQDRPLTAPLTGVTYSNNLYVDTFFPCDGSTPIAPGTPVGIAANTITATAGTASQAVWDDPDVAGTPADLPISMVDPTGLSNPVNLGACGEGGSLLKYYDGTAAANNTISWPIALTPPVGAASIIDALLVDQIPDGTDDVYTYRTGSGHFTDFTTYFCELPGIDHFDAVAFDAFLDSDACQPAIVDGSYDKPPAGLDQPTHVVFHAPEWGGDGVDAVRMLGFYVFTHVRADYTSAVYGSEYTNRAQFQGTFDGQPLGNALAEEPTEPPRVNVDDFEAYAIRSVIDWSCGAIEARTDLQPSLRELNPGDCSWLEFRPRARPGFAQPRNAIFDVEVPDGVVIMKPVPPYFSAEPAPIDGIWSAGGCIVPGGQIIDPLPSDRPLRFELGTAASPCDYLDFSGIQLGIEFCLDPDYPFADGQSLDFTAVLVGSDNQGTPAQCPDHQDFPTTASVAFSADVPAELEYFIAPSCQVGGGAAFVGQASNTGGETLTGVELTLKIPRIADGSDVDASFVGVDQITNAPTAIVQVSTQDPAVTWVAVGDMAGAGITNADVRWVRLVDPSAPGITIPALTGAPVSFRVLLQAPGATGSALASAGTAHASEISVPVEAAPPSFVLGSCAWLRITKFYDADADGQQDAAETGLEAWPFTVVSATGAIAAAGATDGDGRLDMLLPGGTYAVSESLPAANGPTWAPTTPAGAPSVTQIAAIAIGGGDVSLSFGNSCSCPDGDADLCTSVSCQNVDLLGFGQAAECAPSAEPTCDDGDACTTDSCDPASGACTHQQPGCDAVDYFIPVSDATGEIVGHVRCVLQDGEAPDCIMEAGKVKVFPLDGAAASTCGMAQPPASP